jgi:hypothetical protein
MLRTDDGHEKENSTQESVLYFDSPEQAEAFMEKAKKKSDISYKDLGNGKVEVIY